MAHELLHSPSRIRGSFGFTRCGERWSTYRPQRDDAFGHHPDRHHPPRSPAPTTEVNPRTAHARSGDHLRGQSYPGSSPLTRLHPAAIGTTSSGGERLSHLSPRKSFPQGVGAGRHGRRRGHTGRTSAASVWVEQTALTQLWQERWPTLLVEDDPDAEFRTYCHLFATGRPWQGGCIDDLLRGIADDKAAGALITDTRMQRMHHPYDGGADVFLAAPEERDRERDRHANLLSRHPSGLLPSPDRNARQAPTRPPGGGLQVPAAPRARAANYMGSPARLSICPVGADARGRAGEKCVAVPSQR
ncbi:DUF3885 domain-containing protein [Streptomyces sp. NPDC055134]